MISGESVMARGCLCALWQVPARRGNGASGRLMMRRAASWRQGTYRPRSQRWMAAMGQSEIDQINAGLRRAEFAIKELQKKVGELHLKAATTKTLEEMVALKLEVDELSRHLRTVSHAVHAGNPAPHLRLVSDTEQEALMDRRQPPPRRRLLKSGKILLGIDPIPCTIRNMSERGACLQVQTTVGIPAEFDFVQGGHPTKTCKTIWRDDTQIGVKFIQRE